MTPSFYCIFLMLISWMLIMPCFKKSLIVEQFQENYLNISQRSIGTRGVQTNVLIENCWKSMNSEKKKNNESTTSNTTLKYHTRYYLITFNTSICPINPTPLFHKFLSKYRVRFLNSTYKKWSLFSYCWPYHWSLPTDITLNGITLKFSIRQNRLSL